jgi:hypothetical protein
MSEFAIDDGGTQTEPAASAGESGGEGWSGPSAAEWAQTQEALGALTEFFAPEEEQADFDPFDPQQIRGLIREEVAPVAETFQRLQEEAALEQGAEEASRIVAETAAQLGASVDEGQIRETAERDVSGLAERLLADAGYAPAQIRAAMAAAPGMAFEIVGRVYGVSVADVARTALEQAVARTHGEATRQRGPDGVLQRFMREAQPVRALPRGGPSGVLQAHRRANERKR